MNRNPDEAASSPSPRARKVLDAFDHALAIDEPIPDELVRRAQELYVWRAVDAELLELLVDSAQQDLAVVRDEQLLRFMAFGSEERGVHFECVSAGGRFGIDGMVVPGGRYVVRADRPSGELIVETDDYGTFRLESVEPGSMRLTIRTPAGDVMMTTPWFVLQE